MENHEETYTEVVRLMKESDKGYLIIHLKDMVSALKKFNSRNIFEDCIVEELKIASIDRARKIFLHLVVFLKKISKRSEGQFLSINDTAECLELLNKIETSMTNAAPQLHVALCNDGCWDKSFTDECKDVRKTILKLELKFSRRFLKLFSDREKNREFLFNSIALAVLVAGVGTAITYVI